MQAINSSSTLSQSAVSENSEKSAFRFFLLFTILGAIAGPIVTYNISPVCSEFNAGICFMTLLVGTSVGGVSGLLLATLSDVIFSGRLEEDHSL
ncbi:MAG: hypothetical protein K2X27_27785 [Candidatus Obscuribacterales bacterium]|nr:hypothetical protein [Candidatus Obscuribacterales bacterium]